MPEAPLGTIPFAEPRAFPRISIITVTRNSAASLERTLQSVLSQNYPALEYLVIDGGSSDGTQELLRRYAPHLHGWISEPDRGIYDAMNKGLRLATGDLIGMLNSGDEYTPGILAEVGFAYARSPFAMVVGEHRWCYPGGLKVHVYPRLERLKRGEPLCHQAIFYERRLHQECGEYDLTYPLAADYAFVRQVAARYPLMLLGRLVCDYPLGGASDQGFLRYMREVRSISHALGDPFWRVEADYWRKGALWLGRQILQRLGWEACLFAYRRWKYRKP